MKRPLPTSPSLATVSILLLSSSAAHAKKDNEDECATIRKAAKLYDADNSGGLSRAEFTKYWYGLGDSDAVSDAGEAIMSMPPNVSNMYTNLLCQCHDAFGYGENCCDDTATDDEISATATGEGKPGKGNTNEIWTEVSLKGFDVPKAKGDTKYYLEEFCWYVQDALKEEGVTLDPDMDVVVTADATTTVAATATDAPVSTTGATMPATTAAADEGTTAATTLSIDATTDEPDSDLISAQPTFNWTLTNATEGVIITTEATRPPKPTTTTTEPTTTEATTTEFITTGPETLDPIVLRFVGSTNGEVDADSVELDDVTHAFWVVTLDVLDDIFSKRKLPSDEERRNLEWDFGEQASVFFEGVNMEVKDIDCPDGLVYAGEDLPCLQFKYTLNPIPNGPLTAGMIEEFEDGFYKSVNDNGALYNFLVEEYDDTDIAGMGNPGSGIPFDPNEVNTIETVILNGSQGSSTKSVQGSGFPVGGIIGIAVAAALLALILVGFAVRRRRNKRRDSHQELNDSNLSEDLEANEVNEDAANVEEWLDEEEEPHKDPGMSGVNAKVGTTSPQGSSLAALGVASTVATRLSTGDTEIMMTEKQPWTKSEPVV